MYQIEKNIKLTPPASHKYDQLALGEHIEIETPTLSAVRAVTAAADAAQKRLHRQFFVRTRNGRTQVWRAS